STQTSFSSIGSTPTQRVDSGAYVTTHSFRNPSYSAPVPAPAPVVGKRKRDSLSQPGPPPLSQRSYSHPYASQLSNPTQRQKIPRTLNSAIVLLVLALGAVTGHRTPVPGPLPLKPLVQNVRRPSQYSNV